MTRVILNGTAVFALCSTPALSLDLWPFNKKAQQQAPAADILKAQESEAAGLLADADGSKDPLKIYRSIVDKYPFTQSAATAQYRVAAAYEAEGDYIKAFDEYQILIDNYKFSAQFSKAIDSQFSIAQKARSTKLGSYFGIMKKKTGPEQTAKMFRTVVDNAPQGRNAPQAAFEIAKIKEESGEVEAAIEAYKDVADQYSRHPLAADSQRRVAELSLGRIESGVRDAGALKESRDAASQLKTLFPNKMSEDTLLLQDQINEAQAASAYKIGKFYDKQGKIKAAMIYYSDVLKLPNGPHFQEVRDRVNTLTSKDPSLLEQKSVKISNKQLAVKAETDVKSRPDYLGPPRPAEISQRMRPSAAGSIPIEPIEEANLPTGGDKLAPDATLLAPMPAGEAAAAAKPEKPTADKLKSTELVEPALPSLQATPPPVMEEKKALPPEPTPAPAPATPAPAPAKP